MPQQAFMRQLCIACSGELLPLLDENGAISSDFLTARGFCCGNGCRNCPYEKTKSPSVSAAGSVWEIKE
jgi:hypothetical protein